MQQFHSHSVPFRSINFQRNSSQHEKGASINLVPEYNSDGDDTDNEADVDNKNATKTIDSNNSASLNDAPTTSLSSADETKSMPFTKTSFASIIVGGRSPNQEEPNSLTRDAETTDSVTSGADVMTIENEHVSQKQFKRKRRIEYSISHKRDTNPSETSSGGDGIAMSDDMCDNESTETTVSSKKVAVASLYESFQRESCENQSKSDRTSAEPDQAGDAQKTTEEITQLKHILDAKLQFLCHGQNEIELKPVQVMTIQMQVCSARMHAVHSGLSDPLHFYLFQTLFEAHTLHALHSEYLLNWLNNVSSDLIQLEQDAAPDGWKCVWNR